MASGSNVIIREVRKTEIEQLREIGRATFAAAFGPDNIPANLEKYLSENFNIAQLERELSDPDSHFFFAERGKQKVGYLKVNTGKAQTEQCLENALEIERIYVIPEFQGQNIGLLLHNKAMDIAKEKKVDRIWLGVWEKNTRAIGFYEKIGFEEFDKHVFRLGDEEQTDHMMKLELDHSSERQYTIVSD